MKSISSIAVLAASLLVKDALAGPILGRATVQVDVQVQDEVTVVKNPDGSLSTGVAVAVTTITQGSQASTQASSAAASSTQAATSSVAAPAAPVEEAVKPSSAQSSSTKASATSAKESSTTPKTSATATTLATKVSTTAQASSTAASGTSSGNGSKRGLAYTAVSDTAPFPTASYSWMYNWAVENGASGSNTIPKGIEYVPMLWGLSSASSTTPKDSNFVSGAKAAISAGATHLLGFNEPDQPTSVGADLTVAQAVAGWNANMKQFGSGVKLGSPAVTNGVSTADHVWGLDWLGNFTQQVDVDFICIHWYGGDTLTNSVADFKSHVQQTNSRFPGKNIWITEFQYTGSGGQDQFLEQVEPWLESQSYVERYAYYLAGQGSNYMVSGSSLNTVGNAYVSN